MLDQEIVPSEDEQPPGAASEKGTSMVLSRIASSAAPLLVTTLLSTFLVFGGVSAQETGASAPAGGAKAAQDELDALVGADESDAQAIAVIDRYLEATGGKKTLNAINDRIERFSNKKLTPTGETVMKMSRYLARPVKIREEWELPGMGITKDGAPLTFTQVYDGEKAWVKAMGFVSGLSGKTLTVFVWDKHIDDYFMSWQENGWTAKYVGPSEVSGKPVEVIDMLSFAGNQRLRYSFSSEDGLLLSKVWSEGQAPAVVRKEVTYDEYLKIRFRDNPENWIRHATLQRIFEDGELTLEKVYTEIILNGGLPASTFERPEGPEYDPAIVGQPKEGDAGTATSQPKGGEAKKPVWEKPKPKKPTSKPRG